MNLARSIAVWRILRGWLRRDDEAFRRMVTGRDGLECWRLDDSGHVCVERLDEGDDE